MTPQQVASEFHEKMAAALMASLDPERVKEIQRAALDKLIDEAAARLDWCERKESELIIDAAGMGRRASYYAEELVGLQFAAGIAGELLTVYGWLRAGLPGAAARDRAERASLRDPDDDSELDAAGDPDLSDEEINALVADSYIEELAAEGPCAAELDELEEMRAQQASEQAAERGFEAALSGAYYGPDMSDPSDIEAFELARLVEDANKTPEGRAKVRKAIMEGIAKGKARAAAAS